MNMTNKGFEKFVKPEFKGAKKKEAIRQEKRKAKAEARAAGEEARRRKWEQQRGINQPPTEDRWQKRDDRKPSSNPNRKPWEDRQNQEERPDKPFVKNQSPEKNITPKKELRETKGQKSEVELMPLNKLIAYCGICGRREAAELVKSGLVTVNGDTIYEPGYKVIGNEDVKVKGKRIFLQRNLTYILLNKPKDYITTAKDPEGRKTVLDLIKGATKERVYPVGRLDRNTTGVLLLTNDGELAQKLTHPSFEIKKVYEVRLDKPLTKRDFDAVLNGVTLEDGFVKADSLAFVDVKDKSVIGIEIHSGRNRIVRRIFEHLGYDVRNLDRVMFANLTKKNVERGKWRMLNEKEVRLLKFMNQSFVKKPKEQRN
ncbi:MAG: rRNA pseudouridine synthase [Bacteroidota bacterium]|nr:rRNA pseudouridine synthase [Bacteroidota bacterium]